MSLIPQKHHNCPTCRCTEPLDKVSASSFTGLLSDFSMTKDQALRELHNGNKITHRHFSDDEWMMLIGNRCLYAFEDGCLCEPKEFWKWRTDDSWEDGWKLYR